MTADRKNFIFFHCPLVGVRLNQWGQWFVI